ncbi:phosphoribosylaminoimidazolesuccinocarboxamide synthase [Desulforhabdus amnigena]|jgi:phosphoribosylaminoimidazole-succinocarboxamide synthase|uniref:Phosphoribosylaminoimidazole-succinocarboxamide synthase n=1 Tax=Desulforhabdus amnigena TaxID=40218 RepID=A0A9W6D4L0_9BACT|nr:phosphoribosylaminoimidazolesuccinocarboxamide synthase [Desulforhabdus amnigena]NLJ26945.1 phosphoribosylaminoimidazolesuccinocarboxamide synthase [Deltaproteobacteria bacterium]GLI34463.1 phosphoribosylaminoimidazole-succinocarboxamide synthase [Desulforhabdus amnigena]
MAEGPILETHFPDLKLMSRGKVRDIYDLGDSLLIVATDRISAFDVVMPTPIPDKGKILTQLSNFWLRFFSNMVEQHLISINVADFPAPCQPYAAQLAGRSMWVKKARVLPFECIVRGYLVGSGWKDYQKTGQVCGIPLPPNMQEAQRIPEPIFTPSTKAEKGGHDENVSFLQMSKSIGEEMAARVRDISLKIYTKAAEYALSRGIILADTKLEFGLIEGRLMLIDEVLTPDSSRFWPADRYKVGCSPESFDKQYLRDYLVQSGWKVSDPPPELPADVVANTRSRYLEALERLSGHGLES